MLARANPRGEKMKKFPLALFACATALAISPAALIAQSWNFIFTDGTLTASGTFVVSPVALGTYTNGLGSNVVGNNAYVIDSGTITVTGGPLGTIDGSGGRSEENTPEIHA